MDVWSPTGNVSITGSVGGEDSTRSHDEEGEPLNRSLHGDGLAMLMNDGQRGVGGVLKGCGRRMECRGAKERR